MARRRVLQGMPLLMAATMIVGLAACAPAQPGGERGGSQPQPSSRQGGTLRLAWVAEPETLGPKFLGGSGNSDYEWLFSSTLTYLGIGGVPHAMLAQEIPTQASGGWVVNPDGTMITTYRLRPQNRWHDGTPLTAHDFVFAFEVYTDRDLPVLKTTPENLMERVEALDDHTILVRWKEPYVGANVLGFEQLVPLPRHVFEAKYRTSKGTFVNGEEWTNAYISTGPFKVGKWTPGVGISAVANIDFVLGPPKLDVVDIRFIADPNAHVANLFAGEVDMIHSPWVRAQEAVIARDHWGASGEGYIKTWSSQTSYIDWQFREVPNWQPAIVDIRVRKALLHAIDRQGLNEAINLGFTPLVNAFISPDDPLFAEVDRAITKYPYDASRAAALLAEAGWRTASSGLATNAAGQPLDVELMANVAQEQQATVIVDNWKVAGANSTLFVIPAARARDGELGSNFATARTSTRQIGPEQFVWTASEFPTPEDRWGGSNRGSFFDAEIDRLQNVRMTSLDESQRRQATIALTTRMTELVGPMPFLYSVEVIVARKHVVGPVGKMPGQNGITWNVHEWEVTRSG